MLQAAFVFALIGIAFFGSYQGIRYSEKGEARQSTQHGSPEATPEKFSWDWATHDPVSAGTFVLCFVTSLLAVVTGGLYIATARLARDADRISTKSLEIANKSAAIAVNVERPYVYVSDIELKEIPFPEGKGPPGKAYVPVFTFTNYGRTPAFVTRVGYNHAIVDKLPDVPVYKFTDNLTILNLSFVPVNPTRSASNSRGCSLPKRTDKEAGLERRFRAFGGKSATGISWAGSPKPGSSLFNIPI